MKLIFNRDKFRKDLQDKMIAKGVSYRDLSLQVKCSKSWIFSILKGKSEPRVSDFIFITNMLDMNAYEYFEEEEEIQLRLL